ncbi:hypothetical protein HFO15_01720 [Rhizobium laguerreae]|uniref:hypothetical protein n=1 Tax=Rhizobium laguerreae TaxID=1076926 RepID=UPI001C9007B9|nr:hypothetical protein [Rhizobium laguerreae]MBY3260385.1 hypothetical protein [Rhizobium laguerreae]MBY3335693.1 hypothetical protein [Rhizobium laguerreae]
MKMYLLARRLGVVAISLASASCATVPAEFNKKPLAANRAAFYPCLRLQACEKDSPKNANLLFIDGKLEAA